MSSCLYYHNSHKEPVGLCVVGQDENPVANRIHGEVVSQP